MQEVQQVLNAVTIDGKIVRLPQGQLDRKLYEGVKKALEGQDSSLIQAKTTELQERMQKIGEELSKAGQQQQQAGPAPKEKPKSDVVEDAEVEILDDEK